MLMRSNHLQNNASLGCLFEAIVNQEANCDSSCQRQRH